MKVTWIENIEEGVPTGNGKVTGINRSPVEGEKVIEKPAQFFKHSYYPEMYSVVNNDVVPMSEEEKEIYLKEKKTKEALLEAISIIDKENRENNEKTFKHTVRDTEYTFVADRDTLRDIAIECIGLLVAGLATPQDPVPAPEGKWKTDETLEDGLTPVYIEMTIEEFLQMKSSAIQRGVFNFGVKEFHKNTVKDIVKSSGKPEDIKNYVESNVKQGWK